MAVVYNLKRVLVLALSLALAVISIVGIVHSPGVGSLIINIFILVCALYGFIGAMQENPRYLQIFLLCLAVLLVWMIIFIIVAAVAYHYSTSALVYDIVLCVLLAIGLVVTADVTRGAKYHNFI